MTELSHLSLGDLRDLKEQVKTEMKNREAEEIQKARDQILAIAQSVGVPLETLFAKGGKGSNKRASSGPVAVRFQHPEDQSLKWTGRGRQPKWVKEWVDGGKSIVALRVT